MGLCGSKKDNPKNKTYHIQTLDDHEGGINCMSLSADGSVLATGSEDRTARLWSSRSERCECIGILRGHDDYINCILIEDSYVITGSADKTLRKWEMTTCDCVLVMEGHNSLVNRLICTGDFIFSSSYDRTIRCWDFDTGECIRVFSGHKRGVYPLIFVPAEEKRCPLKTLSGTETKTSSLADLQTLQHVRGRLSQASVLRCLRITKEQSRVCPSILRGRRCLRDPRITQYGAGTS